MEAWLGTILPVAFHYAPDGWAMAHGQKLRVDQHQGLFSVLLTTYGGNGQTDFGLPDLRARVPIGYDDRNKNVYGIAKTGGAEFVSLTAEYLPAHAHAATFEATKADVSVTIPAQAGNLTVSSKLEVSSANGLRQGAATGDMLGANATTAARLYTDTSTNPVELKGLSVTVSGNAGTSALAATVKDMVTGGKVTVQPAGLSAPKPLDVRMPHLAVNFIVCLSGIYPPKP